MIRVHYSCPSVGEYWDVGYFKTKPEAIRYVEERMVDERSGSGCYFEDFHFDEIEEDLIEVDMDAPLKFNPYYKKHRDHFKGILKCKICRKKIEPNEIQYKDYRTQETEIAHKQCIKDKKFGTQFSEIQKILND